VNAIGWKDNVMASVHTYNAAASELRRPGKQKSGTTPHMREMVRLATLAASSHNTQPWKFRIGHESIEILPDFERRCPVVDPDDAHLFKSLGCAAENLTHAAAAQGCATEVRFDAAAGSVLVKLRPSSATRPTDEFHAITVRQCTKTIYDCSPLTNDHLRALKLAGQGASARTMFLTERKQIEAVVEYVNQGNHAQLSDPAFRRELISWIRFSPGEALRTRDGLSGTTGGQPSIPRWLAQFIIPFVLTHKTQVDTDARNIRSSSAVAILVASGDDKPTWVEIGRAYERLALRATAFELRNAFINQPIEVRSLRPQFESWLGLKGEKAHLIVRIGRARLAPYSLRRPIDEVILNP
jgi:hypothetical protein